MPFIAILGCDGSGKSTVIKKLTEQLLDQNLSIRIGHWRPRIGGTYAINADKSAAEHPHAAAPRDPISSILKLCWLGLNWWVEWLRVLRRQANTGYLIFDRFHTDLLVDPIRYRYGGSRRLAKVFSRLMPQPDLVIYLDAPPKVLLSRKREVTEEALNIARKSYLKLCAEHDNYHVLDTTESIDVVVSHIRSKVNAYVRKQ